MSGKYSAICLQEAQYVQHRRFEKGYLTNSKSLRLKIWTKTPHSVLKNEEFCQIVQIVTDKKTMILINIHLSNNPMQRKSQINELTSDINCIEESFNRANTIITGDFNCLSSNIHIPHCAIRGPNIPTWRKNSLTEYVRGIDHVFTSERCSVYVKVENTESDHRALISKVLYVDDMRDRIFPTVQSRLAKGKTVKSEPESWTSYPNFQIQAHISGKRISETFRNEKTHAINKKNINDKLQSEALGSRESWNKAMLFSKLKPYSFTAPLLSKNKEIITRKSEYVLRSREILQKATGQDYKRKAPRTLRLGVATESHTINRMKQGLSLVNTQTSCGPDGCHPI